MKLLKFGIEQSGIKSSPFVTKWRTTTNAESITLPLVNMGTFNFYVKWGDGSASTITAWNSASKTHTYATAGDYIVEITGDCPSWSFNNTGSKLKIINVIDWGTKDKFTGFTYLDKGFYGCTNLASLGIGKILITSGGCAVLTSLFRGCSSLISVSSTLFGNCVNTTSFSACFASCTSLSSLPADLFRNNTSVTTFNSCFSGCTSLTSIPVDLFRYNTSATTFSSCFSGCTGLTSIPADTFKYNTSAYNFSYCFNGCTGLNAIPNGLFDANLSISTFEGCFLSCTNITEIPTDLFKYNTGVTSFNGCFKLTGISSVPLDLFRYIPSVTDFSYCFENCANLETVPAKLFKDNVNVTTFNYCFSGCVKLQLNSYIFYSAGEQATRFLNQSVYFISAFYRTSFSGSQGTAPDLWNCSFGTGTPETTSCFGGDGNSLTSISNYADIPSSWIV